MIVNRTNHSGLLFANNVAILAVYGECSDDSEKRIYPR